MPKQKIITLITIVLSTGYTAMADNTSIKSREEMKPIRANKYKVKKVKKNKIETDARHLTKTPEEYLKNLTNTPEKTLEDLTKTPEEALEDLTNTSEETLEDLTNTSEEALEDLTNTPEEALEDLTNTSEETLEDLTNTPEETLEDLTNTPKETLEDLTNTTKETLEDLTKTPEEYLKNLTKEQKEWLKKLEEERSEELEKETIEKVSSVYDKVVKIRLTASIWKKFIEKLITNLIEVDAPKSIENQCNIFIKEASNIIINSEQYVKQAEYLKNQKKQYDLEINKINNEKIYLDNEENKLLSKLNYPDQSFGAIIVHEQREIMSKNLKIKEQLELIKKQKAQIKEKENVLWAKKGKLLADDISKLDMQIIELPINELGKQYEFIGKIIRDQLKIEITNQSVKVNDKSVNLSQIQTIMEFYKIPLPYY